MIVGVSFLGVVLLGFFFAYGVRESEGDELLLGTNFGPEDRGEVTYTRVGLLIRVHDTVSQ